MQCPICNVELKMADRQGVEIDYCPQCRGVWLDRGELDKIIERTAGDPRSRANVDGYDDDDDEAYPYEKRKRGGNTGEILSAYFDEDANRSRSGKKRRGGFLSDVFDFFGDD